MELTEFKTLSDRIVDSVGEVFVGERTLLMKMLAAALANGHVLFEDNPGLGKTLLAKNFARVIGCRWGRVQFTADLMPSDITGIRVWNGSQSGPNTVWSKTRYWPQASRGVFGIGVPVSARRRGMRSASQDASHCRCPCGFFRRWLSSMTSRSQGSAPSTEHIGSSSAAS
jgi:hypothetical protein